ncbi:MAG: 5'/3'-nucleotidase SurE [Anaerolineae bacterium]|nr:5'/3'-nucleotidase SurE [Anaerolineae bacterium]MDW8100074.1 5'/3'-nucleotidase SurE [Anaerolineae bacterium]
MTESTPLILITNDDGLASPGLTAAVKAVRDLGDLLIVAPTEQQSGMGRSMPGYYGCAITPHTLNVDGKTYTAYAVDGSPAQAVLHALLSLADRRPALAIAGINHGENLGTSTTISGTVGAALQAGDMGVPGLAVSLEVPSEFHYNHNSGDLIDWSPGIYFTRYFAQRLLQHGLPRGVHAVKVDIPAEATPRTPWRVTRQSLQPYYNSVTLEGELRFGVPRPLTYHVQIDWETLEPDSDIWAFVRDRVVSVTPLTLDLSGGVDLCRFAAVIGDP